MKIALMFGAIAASLTLSAYLSARAEDYSPTDKASIRTLRVAKIGGGYRQVTVGFTNHTSGPIDANFDCTLYDEKGVAFSSIEGPIMAAPPEHEIVGKSTPFTDAAASADCRIEFTHPSRQ